MVRNVYEGEGGTLAERMKNERWVGKREEGRGKWDGDVKVGGSGGTEGRGRGM